MQNLWSGNCWEHVWATRLLHLSRNPRRIPLALHILAAVAQHKFHYSCLKKFKRKKIEKWLFSKTSEAELDVFTFVAKLWQNIAWSLAFLFVNFLSIRSSLVFSALHTIWQICWVQRLPLFLWLHVHFFAFIHPHDNLRRNNQWEIH